MGLRLFNLLFFTGVAPLVLSVPLKYYLIPQSKTWTEAQAYCRSKYTDLVTIETEADMIHLRTEARNRHLTSSAWIGLWNDVNSWRWSLGNEPLGNYTNWQRDLMSFHLEPNNKDGNQTCGRINRSDWDDTDCATPLPFMCFDERETGTDRYVYYSALKTWPEAQTFCRQFHTDLASARSSSENWVIKNKLSLHTANWDRTWFGLFRDSWKWSDQTNVSTISWMPGQPDNALWNENCGYVLNGLVADGLCLERKPFFCYNAITGQQQIIRMKLQSDQDANDPAVKAAITKQIERKLKTHGMENMTVIWRQE